MAYLRVAEARSAAVTARQTTFRSASQILTEDAKRFSSATRYDVFLSHSYKDAELILGVKALIEKLGLSVYVDWIDDSLLDRSQVTAKTAEILRLRMRASSSLIYVHSPKTSDSVWMPWELGYFDGFRPSFVWILPLVADSDTEFKGQEYLGLYPTVDKIAGLSDRLNLGFPRVGDHTSPVTLAQAARGHGVYLKAQ